MQYFSQSTVINSPGVIVMVQYAAYNNTARVTTQNLYSFMKQWVLHFRQR